MAIFLMGAVGTAPSRQGCLFGVGIKTDLEIPLLPEMKDPCIQIGTAVLKAPPVIPCYEHKELKAYRDDRGSYLIVANTIAFRIDRQSIMFGSADNIDMDLLFLFALPYLLSLLGRESLHGCVVERGGHGLAILGAPGSGKSTTALRLVDRGFHLVADDLVVFDRGCRALPGPSFIRLRPDQITGLEGQWDRGGKFRYSLPVSTRPVPLKRILILDGSIERLQAVGGVTAVDLLLRNAASAHVLFPHQGTNRFALAALLAKRIPILGTGPRSLSHADLTNLVDSMPSELAA